MPIPSTPQALIIRHYSVVIAYLPCYCPHQWKTDIPKQILHMYLQLLQTKSTSPYYE